MVREARKMKSMKIKTALSFLPTHPHSRKKSMQKKKLKGYDTSEGGKFSASHHRNEKPKSKFCYRRRADHLRIF